ncbi:class I SAM-dependent methyltransferase [Methanobrevibacter sp.]|uniref:class I SAM-dependent methyltransferase n=1 Tax=Methanobrevibacter sp. TaxID=66852 RepID=UPI003890BD90
MHKNSHSKMEWFKNTYLNTSKKLDILDVGSLDSNGDYNYSDIFDEEKWTYTGLDFQGGNNVDIIVTDIYNWFEVEDNKYDVIISGQLFEHLEFFWITMSEIERVLKPGGYVCIIAPSAGPKHGGNIPNCYRFHEDGLRAMAKYVDLEVLDVSVDERKEVAPWNDACLVAHKAGSSQNAESKELENRIDDLENKLDTILQSIQK